MPKRRAYTDEDIRVAVKTSLSVRSVLMKLGLAPKGGNYRVFHDNVKRLGLDITHFTGKGHLKGKRCPWTKKHPLKDILVENSTYTSSYHLKKRLLKEGLLEDKCSCCGITEWLGEKLSLHLDHINGIRDDNRIENIRLVCPNCHSLTPTYAGKNIGVVSKTYRSK